MAEQLQINFTKSATIRTVQTHRTMRYRLLPRSRRKANLLAGTAGSVRFLWNYLLDRAKKDYQAYLEKAEKDKKAKKPSVSFYTFTSQYLDAKAEHKWLNEYATHPVRNSAAKPLSVSFQNFFKKQAGFPKFRGKRGDDSFAFDYLPNKANRQRLENNVIHVPKIGLMDIRRKGVDPYKGFGKPKTIRIKQEGKRWYAYICYEITVPEAREEDLKTAVGLDMNVGQVALSNGDMVHLPNTKTLEAKRKRYQRKLSRQKKGSNRRLRAKVKLAKVSKKIADVRDHHNHVVSRKIADNADVVVIEDLNVKGMTASAKGKGKKAKAGLNRSILSTGWGGLKEKLNYKTKRVEKVDPTYTSQACNQCGHVDKANRPTQAKFKCTACGHIDNADINAAKNILASVFGATG